MTKEDAEILMGEFAAIDAAFSKALDRLTKFPNDEEFLKVKQGVLRTGMDFYENVWRPIVRQYPELHLDATERPKG